MLWDLDQNNLPKIFYSMQDSESEELYMTALGSKISMKVFHEFMHVDLFHRTFNYFNH
jgi:hypothetical protein